MQLRNHQANRDEQPSAHVSLQLFIVHSHDLSISWLFDQRISDVWRDFDKIDTNRLRLLFLKVSKLFLIVTKVKETGKKKKKTCTVGL